MKTRIACLWLAGGLCLASLSAHALEPASAQYQVSYNGMDAIGNMALRPASGTQRWTYTLTLGNRVASIEQATVFDASGPRYLPLASSRHLTYPLGRRAVTTRFNWREGRVSWTGDVKPAKRGPVALQRGDMDPLLLNLSLASDAAAGRSLNYRVAENGRVRPMAYTRLRNQDVTVDGKRYSAIRLFHADGAKKTVVWVVPGVPLPVRILQHEPEGDTIDLRMQSWRKA